MPWRGGFTVGFGFDFKGGQKLIENTSAYHWGRVDHIGTCTHGGQWLAHIGTWGGTHWGHAHIHGGQ